MVEKGIRGELREAIHRYVKAKNKYLKDYDKNKESSYLKYRDVNDIYKWVMSKKMPVNFFKWIDNASLFSRKL